MPGPAKVRCSHHLLIENVSHDHRDAVIPGALDEGIVAVPVHNHRFVDVGAGFGELPAFLAEPDNDDVVAPEPDEQVGEADPRTPRQDDQHAGDHPRRPV